MHALKRSGFTEEQAESVLTVIESAGEAGALKSWMLDTFATKLDLQKMHAAIILWLIGAAFSIVAMVLGGVYFLINSTN